jgi:hypothetical protein
MDRQRPRGTRRHRRFAAGSSPVRTELSKSGHAWSLLYSAEATLATSQATGNQFLPRQAGRSSRPTFLSRSAPNACQGTETFRETGDTNIKPAKRPGRWEGIAFFRHKLPPHHAKGVCGERMLGFRTGCFTAEIRVLEPRRDCCPQPRGKRDEGQSGASA